MINIAVFFGGRTSEHDVSIITAQQMLQNMDRTKYNPVPVYITRDGDWFSGEKLLKTEAFKNFNKNDPDVYRVYLPANTRIKQLYKFNVKPKRFGKTDNVFSKIDAAIIAMHGLNGEDGTLQGLLELAQIPYTSCGVLGSSAGMDKILMKAAFMGAGLNVLPYIYFDRDSWEADREKTLNYAEVRLPYPMFVKPANLGSSIGISRATDRASLEKAIDIAIQYDRRILVEQGIDKPTEINCSALGYGNDIRTSVCEMPNSGSDFLTFDLKYMNGSKNSAGMEALARKIPAPISDELTAKIQETTKLIFKLMDCKGVIRIDYICSPDLSELYVNEINTIPGSFAFYLWEPLGISYPQLIDILIETAFKAADDKKKNNFAYDSEIIAKFSNGCSKAGIKGWNK